MSKKSTAAARNFANENFLSFKTLVTIADIKYQFLELLVDIGFVPVNLSGRRRRTGDDIVADVTGSDVSSILFLLTFFWIIIFYISLITLKKIIVR